MIIKKHCSVFEHSFFVATVDYFALRKTTRNTHQIRVHHIAL